MAWSEVDLDKAEWTIPADRMKGDAGHVVPLAPASVEILKSLPRWPGPFVFSTTDGRRPIADFSGIKEKIDALMPDVDPWLPRSTAHDAHRLVAAPDCRHRV